MQKISKAKGNCRMLATSVPSQEAMNNLRWTWGLHKWGGCLDLRGWEIPAGTLSPAGAQGRGWATRLCTRLPTPRCGKGVAHWGPQEQPSGQALAGAGLALPALVAAGRKTACAKTTSSTSQMRFPEQRRTPALKGHVGRIPIFLPLL